MIIIFCCTLVLNKQSPNMLINKDSVQIYFTRVFYIDTLISNLIMLDVLKFDLASGHHGNALFQRLVSVNAQAFVEEKGVARPGYNNPAYIAIAHPNFQYSQVSPAATEMIFLAEPDICLKKPSNKPMV